MTIRIRFKHLVLVGVPVLLALLSLVVHPDYWGSADPREPRPGLAVLVLTGVLAVGFVATHSQALHDHLSRPHWHRFHYVQSNPAQATVTLWLGRWMCVALLWGIGVLGILGRFAS